MADHTTPTPTTVTVLPWRGGHANTGITTGRAPRPTGPMTPLTASTSKWQRRSRDGIYAYTRDEGTRSWYVRHLPTGAVVHNPADTDMTLSDARRWTAATHPVPEDWTRCGDCEGWYEGFECPDCAPCPDCPDGMPCVCTATSIDPLD